MLTFANYSNLEWMEELHDVCVSIEEFQAELQYSNESALLSILDFFGRIFNSLKTSMTKFLSSVKRGELKKYVEDHAATVSKIDHLNIDNEAFVTEISTPSGMKASYSDAVKFLNEVFTKLDLKATLKSIKSTLHQFSISLQRNNDSTVQVGSFAATMNSKKDFIEQSMKSMEEKFSGSDVVSRKFKEEFKSVGEFVQTKQEIIEAEKNLEDVQSISALTDDLTAIISDIESKKDTTVFSSVAQSLSESAHTLAKAIDLYGISVMNLMALAHNFTLIYNRVAVRV